MNAQRWNQVIEVNGQEFVVECVKRPFREGIEVRIETPQGVISFAELGLGDSALLEKARALIIKTIARNPTSQ